MEYPDVSELDLETKIGQLLMVGFPGTEPTDALEDLVTERGIGNFIYFSRNITDPEGTAALSRELMELTTEQGPGIPPLIATDQEGGIVSRLDWGTQLPGQMLIGAAGDPDLARRAGEATGRELASVGINMDFAPVLDVNNNPDNPVIGVRSFGETPADVADLGIAMAEGIQSSDVLACGKHFPGHGDTDTDSHLDLPVVDHDRQRLDEVEFFPFRHAIETGIDSIMTTHVSFPTITGDREMPATVSREVQTGLLREEFGYEGLIVTDCLEMNAISEEMGTPEGAVRAIEAGVDLALVSHTPERQREAFDRLVEAVESGRIAEDRIDESVERIFEYKQTREIGSVPADNAWQSQSEETLATGRDVARAGVTLVRDEGDVVPISPDDELLLVGFPGDEGSNAEDARYEPSLVADSLRDVGLSVDLQVVESADADVPTADYDAVVVATYDAANDDQQAAFVRSLSESVEPLLALAIKNPYDLSAFPSVPGYLVSYDYVPATLTATAELLAGEIEPNGTLPVTVSEE